MQDESRVLVGWCLVHQGFAEKAAEHVDHQAEWEAVCTYFQRAWQQVLAKMQEHAGQ